MVAEIAAVLGFDLEYTDQLTLAKFDRIQSKLTLTAEDEGFADEVEKLYSEVSYSAASSLVQSFLKAGGPSPKVYKIKRSAKGKRISVISTSGVRFAFGPIWNAAIVACKGIALNEDNREKLNMHGKHVGIDGADSMTARELCTAIAGKIQMA